jgi:hypothetical protein
MLSDFSSNFGNVQIEYKLQQGITPKKDKDDAPKTYWLTRTEIPAGTQNKKLVESRRFEYPIAKNVSSLNFRYLGLGNWRDEWGSGDNNLPKAIEISIGLVDSEGNIEILRTAYAVRKPT